MTEKEEGVFLAKRVSAVQKFDDDSGSLVMMLGVGMQGREEALGQFRR